MRYRSEFLLALIFHLFLILFFALSFTFKPKTGIQKPKDAIQAVIFNEADIEQQIQSFTQKNKEKTPKKSPLITTPDSASLPPINHQIEQKKVDKDHAKKFAQKTTQVKQALAQVTQIKRQQQKQTEEKARLAAIEKTKKIAQQQIDKAKQNHLAEIAQQQKEAKANRLAALKKAKRIAAAEKEETRLAELKKQEIEQEKLKTTLATIEKEVALKQQQLALEEKKESDKLIAEAEQLQILAQKKQREQAEKIKQQQLAKKIATKKAADLAKIKQQKSQEAARLAATKSSKNLEKEKQRLKAAIAADMASRQQSSKTVKQQVAIEKEKRQQQAEIARRQQQIASATAVQQQKEYAKRQQAQTVYRQKQAAQQQINQKIATENVTGVQQQLAQQQTAAAERIKAEQDRREILKVMSALSQKVKASWNRPISMTQGLSCIIRVKLSSSGQVIQATLFQSSGDSFFDRSALNAVHKASPLPIPDNQSLFEKQFKSFTFTFKPE